MDEIDAVAATARRHGGGHDEREQTLNQLLVEMDGFEMKDNIILIAATNRPTSSTRRCCGPAASTARLSSTGPTARAARRSRGPHPRQAAGQEHRPRRARGQTPGFTGADLANLINEAALLTARSDKREITMKELEEGSCA